MAVLRSQLGNLVLELDIDKLGNLVNVIDNVNEVSKWWLNGLDLDLLNHDHC